MCLTVLRVPSAWRRPICSDDLHGPDKIAIETV